MQVLAGEIMNEKQNDYQPQRLPDWWWVKNSEGMPHRYVCPFLITLSIKLQRIKGKDVFWRAATKNEAGEWLSPATAVTKTGVSWGESSGKIPQKWAHRECDFWNSRIGVRLRKPIKGRFA